MRAGLRIAAFLALAGVLAGCALLPSKPVDVMGSAAYRTRNALPSNAVMEVTLFDVSQGVSGAPVVATQSIPLNGRQGPVDFDLVVQPGWLKAKGDYVLRAQIVGPAGEVLYATDKEYPVTLGKAPPEVQLVLKPVKKGP